jgi:DNA polymerase-1
MKKALVIDGNSMVYRMFYASLNQLEYYKARNLQPANAIKLFLLVLLKILTQTKYDYALVAFDHQKKTLRHNEFAEYKAGRKPMPEDLFVQLPVLKELIEDLGVHVLSMEGIEADDIIGSYAKKNNKNGVEVDIFSSDKDMLQLVNELTVVNLMKTGISDIRKVSLETFKDNFFGLTPEQVNDFKGIAGDSSDNLMGVKGIGEVSAVNLLKQ